VENKNAGTEILSNAGIFYINFDDLKADQSYVHPFVPTWQLDCLALARGAGVILACW
jgi:hypothetical protein